VFDLSIANAKIAVIGLGYVGLPLAVEFGKNRPVVGYDIDNERIKKLREGRDATGEVEADEINSSNGLSLTFSEDDLTACNTFIVTVPTPVDSSKRPDLGALVSASETVGQKIAPGNVVIYESTVYPGATEEICVPVLERVSGLEFNVGFFVGYSPERINPGDTTHQLSDICKVTSGSTTETADYVDALYRTIITAGTHKTESIRVAEAAKVIENTQRDINIALINELSMVFNKLGIDTEAVLKAAETKWNFQSFRPGLVGGHCIGVDPYYLTHKAQAIGYHPEIILAGRRLNDRMGAYVAEQMVKTMLKRGISVGRAKVLVLGLAFKENCSDLRNTRVIDTVQGLMDFGLEVDVYDPYVDSTEALQSYGIVTSDEPAQAAYEGIILAVAHDDFRKLGVEQVRAFGKPNNVLFDLKYVFRASESDLRL